MGQSAEEEFQFLCKAASHYLLQTLHQLKFPLEEEHLKVYGDRTFDTWTITVINDENFRLRTKFEQWMNGISKLTDASGATNLLLICLVLLSINLVEVLIKTDIQMKQ